MRRAIAPLAWLCLLLQTSAVAHFVLVRHSLCGAHGALVEVHDGAHASDAPPDTATQASITHQSDHHDDGSEVGHDHCALSALQRSQLTPPRSAEPLCQPPAATPPAIRTVAALRPLSVYHLAPKTSPPV